MPGARPRPAAGPAVLHARSQAGIRSLGLLANARFRSAARIGRTPGNRQSRFLGEGVGARCARQLVQGAVTRGGDVRHIGRPLLAISQWPGKLGMAQELQAVVLDLWSGLGEIKSRRSLTSGAVLFGEGEVPSRVYLVEKGQVRIVISTERGGSRLLATAGAGTLLGLSEAIGGEPHKVSARSVGECEVSYVEREDLLDFLAKQPRLCMQIVRLLSEDLHSLYHQFRDLSTQPGGPSRRRTAKGRFQ